MHYTKFPEAEQKKMLEICKDRSCGYCPLGSYPGGCIDGLTPEIINQEYQKLFNLFEISENEIELLLK